MWTAEDRRRYDRSHLRYERDLTDAEWAEIAPETSPAKRDGNKRTVNIREVINGITYLLSIGCFLIHPCSEYAKFTLTFSGVRS